MYLRSMRGAIASPRALDVNESGQCVWHFTAPRDRRIKFQVAYFRTKAGSTCFHDYVEIRDGRLKPGEVLGRFCEPGLQPSLGPAVYSTGQEMVATFKYGENAKKAEFVAVFEHVLLSVGKCCRRNMLLFTMEKS